MLPSPFQGRAPRTWDPKRRFQKNGFSVAATTQFIAGWFMVTPISMQSHGFHGISVIRSADAVFDKIKKNNVTSLYSIF